MLSMLILSLIFSNACANLAWSGHRSLAYTVPSSITSDSKEKLRNLALDLNSNSPTGAFILEPEPKKELQKVASELESICGPPTEEFRESMIGDWKLLCTMNTPKFTTPSITNKSPFEIPDWLRTNPVQEKIRESVEVIQRIRCIGGGNLIDRVDNIIAFSPFSIEELVSSSTSFNLNPLEVSKSKVTLAHKAEVQSIKPVLRTKISLESIILTVAGASQYLDPQGADILGLNVPLGEFLNAGSFDTTYVDEDIRISRGSAGLFDQLRVFARIETTTEEEVVEEEEVEDNLASEEIVAEIESEESDEDESPAISEESEEDSEDEKPDDGTEDEKSDDDVK